MISLNKKEKCVGCGACVQICPQKCIQLIKDEEGFFYPKIDVETCINCGQCDKTCPCLNEVRTIQKSEASVHGLKNIDDNIRFHSSSGGVFSTLAEYVLDHNGIVFGVTMTDDNRSAQHIFIQHKEDIYKLQGSKYIQSNINNAYVDVKNFLNVGKMVLFTGTPCQIKALRLFLKKEYENLICVEIICHGVPSPLLWYKYIEHIEEVSKSKVKEVNFRSKQYGWKEFGLLYSNPKEKRLFKFHFEDPFFRMFCDNICLRPSCYDCLSKDRKSGADISLGDFWNIEKISPTFNDNRGVSMVLVHTKKGDEIFNEIKGSFTTIDSALDYDIAKSCNPAINLSPPINKRRLQFYVDLASMDFKQVQNKYVPSKFKFRVKSIMLKTGTWKLIDKIRGG